MNISEIFYSIQGEGPLIGQPCIFIRTSGCNLRCKWCDTKYTSWYPEKNEMTLNDIVNKIKTFPCNQVVITGGEPYIQKDLPELTKRLKRLEYHISMETNGTIYSETAADLIMMSPKLTNSIPIEKSKLHQNEMNKWLDHKEKFQSNHNVFFKFVVNTERDILELLSFGIEKSKIIIMPEGLEVEKLRKNTIKIIDLCKKYNLRFTPRLHVLIWGNKRAV